MGTTTAKVNSFPNASNRGGKPSPQEIARNVQQQIGGSIEHSSDEPGPISFEIYKETGQKVTIAADTGNGFPITGSSSIEYISIHQHDPNDPKKVAKTDPKLGSADVLKDPDVSSADYLQKFIKPLDDLGGITISAIETVGRVAPGAFKDGKEAVGDLWSSYILGKQEQKQPTPEEKAKLEKEKITQAVINKKQVLQMFAETQNQINQINQQKGLMEVFRITEKSDVTTQDVSVLGFSNITPDQIKDAYHLTCLRNCQIAQNHAAKIAREARSAPVVTMKGKRVDLRQSSMSEKTGGGHVLTTVG